MSSRSSPVYRLVSLNTSPERAKKVIGAVIENVKEKYRIEHIANAECLLRSLKPPPQILFCASMWTAEEQIEAQKIARGIVPDIKTYGIPTGLHSQVGPDGIIKHITERIDDIMQ